MKFKHTITTLTASALLIIAPLTQAASSVWKVSKGTDYIYLGGTVHILPKSEFPLPLAYKKAYNDTQSIVLEADLPDESDIQAQMELVQKMAYTNGQTLSTVLDANTYQQLSKFLANYGTNIQQVNGFKPGFIMTLLATLAAQKANLFGEGVDAYFSKLAKKDKKLAEYLETTDFQVQMLANLGNGHENEFIQSTIKQMADFEPVMKAVIASWRAGDTQKLQHLLNDVMIAEDAQTYKTMISDRNINWISKIEMLFTDQDKEFVLVGAAHLTGQDNVLSLLKNKGYTIVQM